MSEQDNQTFTKEDVEKLLTEKETAIKTELETKFQDHIKKLNDENASRRISEKTLKTELAKMLNLGDAEKPELDVIKEKLAEIANKNKELEEKYTQAEQEKTKLQKTNEAKELAEKAGLNKKLAVKLIDLDGDIQAQVEALAKDFPELKVRGANMGAGTPPAGGANPAFNPWKKETRNLTLQAKILRENPALAAQMQEQAK